MFRRGRSEEPEFLSAHRTPINLQMDADKTELEMATVTAAAPVSSRARSLGPSISRIKHPREPPKYGELGGNDDHAFGDDKNKEKLSHSRATLNRNVNPYTEFPSLRRGMTMRDTNDIPTVLKSQGFLLDTMPDPTKDGDSCSYYFWVAMYFLLGISFINFIFNVVLIWYFRITPSFGFNNLEFIPEEKIVKLMGEATFLDHLILQDGLISGFQDEPLHIEAQDGQAIVLQVSGSNEEAVDHLPQLRVAPDGVFVENVDDFKLVSPENGQVYFDMNHPQITIEGPIEDLEANEVIVDRIMSPLGDDLLIKSDAELSLEALNALTLDSKVIHLNAATDINMEADKIVIDAKEIQIDPRALPLGGGNYPTEVAQYKLCICLPGGRLFRVPVPKLPNEAQGPMPKVSCSDAESWEYHPCAD